MGTAPATPLAPVERNGNARMSPDHLPARDMAPRGRLFFANPGPTNIPDSVLRAMDGPSIDFNEREFLKVYDPAVAGLKRVLRTATSEVFLYAASGHGAWEATHGQPLLARRPTADGGNRLLLG